MTKQFVAEILIALQLVSLPMAQAATAEFSYSQATPSEARSEGQFIHGAGPGKLMIRVHLMGAIGSQGIHYYPEKVNILDAILWAGGQDTTSKLDSITIRRTGEPELIRVNLEELLEEGHEMPVLQDGDVVQIPFNWRRDIQNIGLITALLGSLAAFTISVITLARPSTAN